MGRVHEDQSSLGFTFQREILGTSVLKFYQMFAPRPPPTPKNMALNPLSIRVPLLPDSKITKASISPQKLCNTIYYTVLSFMVAYLYDND